MMMAIPQLIFALLLMTIATAWAGSERSILTLYMVVIIAVLDSTRVFRLSRAVGMNIVVMDFFEAAKLRGEKLSYLIFSEIAPNAFAPLLAGLDIAAVLGGAIITEQVANGVSVRMAVLFLLLGAGLEPVDHNLAVA